MPSTALGYRYPADTEQVKTGPAAIQALAEDVQKNAGIGSTHSASITVSNAGSGSVTITYPNDTVDGVSVPRFSAPPIVVANSQTSQYWFAAVSAITNTGCTLWLRQRDNASESKTLTVTAICRQDA